VGQFRKLQGALELREAMLSRAGSAIMCWSAASRVCGVDKDMLVTIAKMVRKEPWHWS
jgi:hypothetical protein